VGVLPAPGVGGRCFFADEMKAGPRVKFRVAEWIDSSTVTRSGPEDARTGAPSTEIRRLRVRSEGLTDARGDSRKAAEPPSRRPPRATRPCHREGVPSDIVRPSKARGQALSTDSVLAVRLRGRMVSCSLTFAHKTSSLPALTVSSSAPLFPSGAGACIGRVGARMTGPQDSRASR